MWAWPRKLLPVMFVAQAGIAKRRLHTKSPFAWALAQRSSSLSGMRWQRPSPRICELMQTGAESLTAHGEVLESLLAEIDEATLADQAPGLTLDPALVAALRRSNKANLLFWVEAVRRDPAAPVAPNSGPEPTIIARDLIRRGLDDSVLQAWRAGQNVAWRRWMSIALGMTGDPDELAELLDFSARSIFGFVDATIALVSAQMRDEREQLTKGTQAERLETVTLLIEGAPLRRAVAESRLGYSLDQSHLAAIVWSNQVEPDAATLGQAAEALVTVAGARRPLTVTASVGALWVWVPADHLPDAQVLESVLGQTDAFVAMGSPASGIDGFRRSHLEALATQRLLVRAGHLRCACWDSLQLVALVGHDDGLAREFVMRTLGDLAHADAELRRTLAVYLREQSNAPRAAKVLFTHRNTVLARVARAERLLPKTLSSQSLEVAVALELAPWIDSRGG